MNKIRMNLYLSVLNMLVTILCHHFTVCCLIPKYEYSKRSHGHVLLLKLFKVDSIIRGTCHVHGLDYQFYTFFTSSNDHFYIRGHFSHVIFINM